MNILLVSFEAAPYAKTGGLGDVAGSLPKALNALGADCRVLMPKFRGTEARQVSYDYVNLSWRRQYCGLETAVSGGVTYYFVDNEYYFGRENVYGYDDDGERAAFFSKCAAELLDRLPGFQPDVVHCNDWHAALTPLWMRLQGQREGTVLTIHNLRFQGACPEAAAGDLLGLDGNAWAMEQLRWQGGLNFLKAGILTAGRVTTVSPSYAAEICGPEYGEGLDGILRLRQGDLRGILNGIDPAAWRSEQPKAAAKAALQAELGLDLRADAPLLGMVSRLTEQKGVELVLETAARWFAAEGQLAVLGTGWDQYEAAFRGLERDYPGSMAACIRFDEGLSRRIYAGADGILAPSYFEPCGLTQMYAMCCGALPVVRATGGLRDSVRDGEDGFVFQEPSADGLWSALERVRSAYGTAAWGELNRRALKRDFSWAKSAAEYLKLYESLS